MLLLDVHLCHDDLQNGSLGLGSWAPSVILVFWIAVALLIVISQVSHMSQVTGHTSHVTGHRSHVASHKSHILSAAQQAVFCCCNTFHRLASMNA
jgi:hypothetical protein